MSATRLEPETRVSELTVAQLSELVARAADSGVEYYTQKTSPLGKHRHIELVKTGAIMGWKDAHTYYARKSDVHAYIESQPVEPPVTDVDELLRGKV